MSEFEAHLQAQYKTDRPFLTNTSTVNGDALTITPRSGQFKASAERAIDLDTPFSHENRQFGSPSHHIGMETSVSADDLNSDYFGAFVFGAILKKPGSDDHRVPQELAFMLNIFQAYADYQYTHNPQATDALALMSCRVLPLIAGDTQLASDWHLHRNFPMLDQDVQRARFFGLDEKSIEHLISVDGDKIQSEMFWSPICPTEMQTARSDRALNFTEVSNAYHLDEGEENNMSHRQLQAGEMVVGDALTWHRAVTVPHTLHGKRRAILVVNYCPVIR